LEALDILFHLAKSGLLIPEESFGAGCEHWHSSDADIVLAAILRMGHVALLGGWAGQGVGFGSRWRWWCHRRQLGDLWTRKELLQGGVLTRSDDIANGYCTFTVGCGNFHCGFHIRMRLGNLRFPIANCLITQLALGFLEIPSSATPTLMTM